MNCSYFIFRSCFWFGNPRIPERPDRDICKTIIARCGTFSLNHTFPHSLTSLQLPSLFMSPHMCRSNLQHGFSSNYFDIIIIAYWKSLVARNEPVTLTCKVRGNPDPTITWFKVSDLLNFCFMDFMYDLG